MNFQIKCTSMTKCGVSFVERYNYDDEAIVLNFSKVEQLKNEN